MGTSPFTARIENDNNNNNGNKTIFVNYQYTVELQWLEH